MGILMGTDSSDDRDRSERTIDPTEASQAEVEAAIRRVEDQERDSSEFLVGS